MGVICHAWPALLGNPLVTQDLMAADVNHDARRFLHWLHPAPGILKPVTFDNLISYTIYTNTNLT